MGGGTTTTNCNPVVSSPSSNANNVSTAGVQRRERQHPPRIDAHRFSRANLEGIKHYIGPIHRHILVLKPFKNTETRPSIVLNFPSVG